MNNFRENYQVLLTEAKDHLVNFIKVNGFIHEQISSRKKVILLHEYQALGDYTMYISEDLEKYDDSSLGIGDVNGTDIFYLADLCEMMVPKYMIKTTLTTSLRYTHENYKFFKNIYELNKVLKYGDDFADNDAIFIGELVNGKWEQIDCEVRLIRNDKLVSFGESVDAVHYYDLSGFEAINDFLNSDSGFIHVVLTKREN